MKELEQELEQFDDITEEALPTIEEQQKIVAELKKLEAEGKLTPEVMESYFGKFYTEENQTQH
ncbi:restriction endonuclease subunit S [Aliivibrio kagoshimensis]|jgi:hypothetical protein|uniref:restriction endonuclease subunit S n=1 Tax=Aliivibrio kagoshimensis TaxID=2910230 RepID=UPI003D0DA98C